MGICAVAGRVDVVAAGQDQAVEEVEHLVRVLLEAAVGRDHHGQPAGALDRRDVTEGEQRGLTLPHPPPRAGERGADADHWPLFVHSSLRLARLIFPEAVFGSSGANSTIRGYL